MWSFANEKIINNGWLSAIYILFNGWFYPILHLTGGFMQNGVLNGWFSGIYPKNYTVLFNAM